MKKPILILNRNWLPVAAKHSWSDAFVGMCSGAFKPVDIWYATNEDGIVDLNTIESMMVINSMEEWAEVPIRAYDEYVTSPKRVYRMPAVVVCAKFDQIPEKRTQFPTKQNIWKRDKYECQYTGEKLTREDLSIDHCLPSSRGGGNTWTNLVTCKKSLNVWKSDRTPEECGLKLINRPFKPAGGLNFDFLRDEWKVFLEGGDFS